MYSIKPSGVYYFFSDSRAAIIRGQRLFEIRFLSFDCADIKIILQIKENDFFYVSQTWLLLHLFFELII